MANLCEGRTAKVTLFTLLGSSIFKELMNAGGLLLIGFCCCCAIVLLRLEERLGLVEGDVGAGERSKRNH